MSVRSGNLGDYGLILHHPVAVVSEGRLIVTGALKKLNPSVPVHAGQLNIAIFDPAGALLVQSVTRYHPETISPRVNRKHGAKFFVVFESLPPDLAMGSVQVSFLNEQVPDH